MNWRAFTDRAMKSIRDTFGETVEYRSFGNPPVSVTAIFDIEHEAVDPETDAIVSTNQPILTVRLADLPAKPKPNDTVVRDGVTFRVMETQEDGHGAARLMLHKTL